MYNPGKWGNDRYVKAAMKANIERLAFAGVIALLIFVVDWISK